MTAENFLDKAALKNWIIELWRDGKDVDVISVEVDAPLALVTDVVEDYEWGGNDFYDSSDYAKDYDLK